jgi:hypothetical protein
LYVVVVFISPATSNLYHGVDEEPRPTPTLPLDITDREADGITAPGLTVPKIKALSEFIQIPHGITPDFVNPIYDNGFVEFALVTPNVAYDAVS